MPPNLQLLRAAYLLLAVCALARQQHTGAAGEVAGGCADEVRDLRAGQPRWGDTICIARQLVR